MAREGFSISHLKLAAALSLAALMLLQQVHCNTVPSSNGYGGGEDSGREINDSRHHTDPCSVHPEDQCRTLIDSYNYSMVLHQRNLYSGKVELRVKIHMTSCPTFHTPSPLWYKLEARQTQAGASQDEPPHSNDAGSGSEADVVLGKFEVGKKGSEVSLCDSNTSLVFKTCEPQPLDLPAHHVWSIPQITASTRVCFRLTLQTVGSEDCEVLDACSDIVPRDEDKREIVEDGSADSAFDDEEESGTHPHGSGWSDMEQLSIVANEVEPGLEDMEDELDELMENIDESQIISYGKGSCTKSKDFYSNYAWDPICDCEGYYKKVQCVDRNGLFCWCSSRNTGDIIAGTRKRVLCYNPVIFEFKC